MDYLGKGEMLTNRDCKQIYTQNLREIRFVHMEPLRDILFQQMKHGNNALHVVFMFLFSVQYIQSVCFYIYVQCTVYTICVFLYLCSVYSIYNLICVFFTQSKYSLFFIYAQSLTIHSCTHVHTTSIRLTNQCSRTLANQAVCIVSHHPPPPLLLYCYSLFIIHA
jgi:hypothetical protein